MHENKIYRVTYFIKKLLVEGVIHKSDWKVFNMNPEMDNKTINRDIAELKRLTLAIYNKELVYNRKGNYYEI